MDIFPTAYFGNILYFKMLAAAVNPIIETQEHFVKQTLRSRCEILGPNDLQILSLPVSKKNGSKTSMDDIEILENDWRKIHWKSIEAAYASSPYFEHYGTEIKELLNTKVISLIEYNRIITERILEWLDLELKIDYSSEYLAGEIQNDYRNFNFSCQNGDLISCYTQVFRSKEECTLNLSILDLILNEGPLARKWIF